MPTVLLLHAFPFDARMWDEVREGLGGTGRPVLAPTLPLSPGRRAMGEWAEDVLALTEGPFVPVGVSMGGYLAFELWRRAGERIPAVVLADTRAGGEPAEGRPARDRAVAIVREQGVEVLWRELEPRVLSPVAPAEVRERAREIVLSRQPEELAAALEAIRDRPDSGGTVGGITAPALVVAGEDDAIVPLAEAAALASALPAGRLRSVPRAGHVPPLERPDAFRALVTAFLDEVVP